MLDDLRLQPKHQTDKNRCIGVGGLDRAPRSRIFHEVHVVSTTTLLVVLFMLYEVS